MPATDQEKRLKALIIDDDLPSVNILADALLRHPQIELCASASSLEEGEALMAEMMPDILFLDMEFPGSNGLEWYDSAPIPASTFVVFYTAYQRYIHDALSGKVFDFLLKPFDPEELSIILRRIESIPGRRQAPAILQPMAQDNRHGSPRCIAITTITNDRVIVSPADILYFRYDSERKLWECVLTSLKRFILKRQSTADIITNFGNDFVRTHKRFIVNVNYLAMISGVDCILLPPFNEITEIKISKAYKKDLLDRFYDI